LSINQKFNYSLNLNIHFYILFLFLFLTTPNIFELTYKRGSRDHPFLHKFKQCFLTNFSVNYTAEGTHTTYGDSTPVSMTMDMTFKEIEPIYDTDYKDNDTSVGF